MTNIQTVTVNYKIVPNLSHNIVRRTYLSIQFDALKRFDPVRCYLVGTFDGKVKVWERYLQSLVIYNYILYVIFDKIWQTYCYSFS